MYTNTSSRLNTADSITSFGTGVARPRTGYSMGTRPWTGQSRPATGRPTTAASTTRHEASYAVALLEGRGVSREIGMAALDKDTGLCVLVQVWSRISCSSVGLINIWHLFWYSAHICIFLTDCGLSNLRKDTSSTASASTRGGTRTGYIFVYSRSRVCEFRRRWSWCERRKEGERDWEWGYGWSFDEFIFIGWICEGRVPQCRCWSRWKEILEWYWWSVPLLEFFFPSSEYWYEEVQVLNLWHSYVLKETNVQQLSLLRQTSKHICTLESSKHFISSFQILCALSRMCFIQVCGKPTQRSLCKQFVEDKIYTCWRHDDDRPRDC